MDGWIRFGWIWYCDSELAEEQVFKKKEQGHNVKSAAFNILIKRAAKAWLLILLQNCPFQCLAVLLTSIQHLIL